MSTTPKFAWAGAIFLGGAMGVFAADPDVTRLPPPATNQVNFTRDIRPIFETSCLRCHGPEKPKSGFRLDNREAALKGGDRGPDILPGNSTNSTLIHFVAGIVEDMEMPPTGKGEPLKAEQISLLRAWIDQGAAWDSLKPADTLDFSVSPIFGGTWIRGNTHVFREQYWQKEGVNGGLEKFELFERTDPNTTVLLSGHSLLDDYKINLAADRTGVGFIHTGWEQYRKYFDDTGGVYPRFAPSAPTLGQDLHLDIGKAWFDLGLTLPDLPRMVFGYEYDYKLGRESTTDWGVAGQSVGAPNIGNLSPNSRSLNEGTHIVKFDLDQEIAGFKIEDRFRGEFYSSSASQTNLVGVLSSGGTISATGGLTTENQNEATHYFQGANTIRVDRQFGDWLYGSGGYLYSRLNSESTFNLDTVTLGLTGNDEQWRVPQITLEKESHVANLNGLFGPFDGLTISTGVQTEWTRQQGFGSGTISQGTAPNAFPFNPATLASDYDETSVQETLGFRYAKIPFTSLFLEGHLEQQRIGQSDQLSMTPADVDKSVFMQDTDYHSDLSDLRVGFNTSPWQRVSFSAQARRFDNDSHYDSDLFQQPPGFQTAYPTFIKSRDVLTDEVEAKLVLRPCNWLKTSLSWQIQSTDYHTDTGPFSQGINIISPGGDLLSGHSGAHIYSINTTFTPAQRFYLSTTLSYQKTSMTTASDGSAAIVPYRGHVLSAMANGTYICSESTDLFAGCTFSEADYGEDNFAGGIPVGMQFRQRGLQLGLAHRLGKHASLKLQYRLNEYIEPSSGGANDYRAQAVFATLTYKFR